MTDGPPDRLTVRGLDLAGAKERVDPLTFGVLSSLVLDFTDDRGDPVLWGAAAMPHHVALALGTMDPGGPLMSYFELPKNSAKTDTAGAVLLARLATCDLPVGSKSYLFARDREQASLVHDSVAGFVQRTPGLVDRVDVQSKRVLCRRCGSQLIVSPADPAGTHGVRPAVIVADEVAWWPATRNARAMWEVIVSSIPKVPGARLFAVSTAGLSGHWAQRVSEGAAAGQDGWGHLYLPGPTPGVSPDTLAQVRASMSPAMYSALWLNRWSSPDGVALSSDDIAAVVDRDRSPHADLPPVPGQGYVVAADLSHAHDRTAIVVAHRELSGPQDATGVVVVDAVRVWTPTASRPVPLGEVKDALDELLTRYRPTTAKVDAHQAVSMVQELAPAHPVLEAMPVTAKVNHALATALLSRFAARTVRIPDRSELVDELERLQLEHRPDGSMRLTKDGGHNDVAWTLGLALSLADADRRAVVTTARDLTSMRVERNRTGGRRR